MLTHRELFGRAFYGAWNDFLGNRYVTQVFAGGRGSLKSSFVSLALVLGIEGAAQEAQARREAGDRKWRDSLCHGVVFRKVAADLQSSVYEQVAWAVAKLGLEARYEFKRSPLMIVRRPTGQKISFRGLDDPVKAKSIKTAFSYYRFAWFEEFEQFDGMEEIRSVRQSVLRGGPVFNVFYSYNPPETSANWVNAYMALAEATDPSLKVYRSDFRDVPREWLGETFFRDAELLRSQNERAWRHEYLGEVTGNGGAIFPNATAREITDAEIARFDNIRIGLDFGFALDPAAVETMHWDKTRRDLYVFREIYGTDMLNRELAERVKGIPELGWNYVVCDSAEPKSVADLESLGVNALGVQKGPDSRRFSMRFLQGLRHIYIDPARCPNAWREFSTYEYMKTRGGLLRSAYPDVNDHAIDAVRYGMMDDAIGAGLF